MAASLPKDAIRTLSYDLNLRIGLGQRPPGAARLCGAQHHRSRLDDITRVGEVIDIAITSGANAVHNVRFDLKDRDTAERRALENGHRERPRPGASRSRRSGGDTVGGGIEEPTGYRVPPPMPMMREAMARDAQAPPTPIVAGEIEIRSTVVLTATLK